MNVPERGHHGSGGKKRNLMAAHKAWGAKSYRKKRDWPKRLVKKLARTGGAGGTKARGNIVGGGNQNLTKTLFKLFELVLGGSRTTNMGFNN